MITKEYDVLKLDQQICFPLYAASNLLTKLYRPLLSELGLTYPQYLVMLVLWEFGQQTVGELGSKLHLDSGTLTPLLKRLESEKLLVRKRDPLDERRVLITLSKTGVALKTQAVNIPARLAASVDGEETVDTEKLRSDLQNLISLLATALDE